MSAGFIKHYCGISMQRLSYKPNKVQLEPRLTPRPIITTFCIPQSETFCIIQNETSCILQSNIFNMLQSTRCPKKKCPTKSYCQGIKVIVFGKRDRLRGPRAVEMINFKKRYSSKESENISNKF